MPRRRIFLSIGLIALALLLAASGALFYPTSHEIIVQIDRSVLDQQKPKAQQVAKHIETPESTSPRSVALKPVPDPRLVEKTELGLLPRKSDTGDQAADIYARPYDPAQASKALPKLSLVIIRAGISETRTVEAYVSLPPDVSISVSPYAQDAQRQIREIRNRGHEVFLDLPSKTDPSTLEDRGPQALDPEKEVQVNRQRLYWMMSRFSGYAGLIGDWTHAAYQSDALRQLVESEMKMRGLAFTCFIRAHSHVLTLSEEAMGGDMREPPMMILPGQNPAELLDALQALDARLKQDGRIIAFIDAGPIALDILKDWIAKRQSHEFDLLPLSALMRSEG